MKLDRTKTQDQAGGEGLSPLHEHRGRGQKKQQDGYSDFSTAVTQGGTALLIEALKDQDTNVRSSARMALEKIESAPKKP